MATDVLILGGVEFSDFSTPPNLAFGGRQALAIHKFPGGERVIDTLGPDEADITWSGTYFSEDAYSQCLLLDSMRKSGQEISLIFGEQFRLVVISSFTPKIIRFPQYIEYTITCVVSSDPTSGVGGYSLSAEALIVSDIAGALGL